MVIDLNVKMKVYFEEKEVSGRVIEAEETMLVIWNELGNLSHRDPEHLYRYK